VPASLSGLAESILVLSATITLFILVQYIVPQSYKVIGFGLLPHRSVPSSCISISTPDDKNFEVIKQAESNVNTDRPWQIEGDVSSDEDEGVIS
jgi:hypothetical protein